MQDFLGFLEPGSCNDLQIRLATSMLVAVLTRLEKENGATNSNQKAGISSGYRYRLADIASHDTVQYY